MPISVGGGPTSNSTCRLLSGQHVACRPRTARRCARGCASTSASGGSSKSKRPVRFETIGIRGRWQAMLRGQRFELVEHGLHQRRMEGVRDGQRLPADARDRAPYAP